MTGFLRTRGTALWIGALVALSINAAVSIYNVVELMDNTDRVVHSQQVLYQLRLVLSDIKDCETGQRGFLLTGDREYLKPHHDAMQQIDMRLRDLGSLTADNPAQQGSVRKLEPLIGDKLAELDFTIGMQHIYGMEFSRFLVLSNDGKMRMDMIRSEIALMQQREDQLHKERTAVAQAKHHATIVTAVVGGVLTIGMTGLAFLMIRRELSRRQEAEELIRRSTIELRHRANELSNAQRQTADFLTLLETFFSNTPVGLAFLSPELRVIRINRILAETLGQSTDKLIGASLVEIPSPFFSTTLPDLRRAVTDRQAIHDRLVHQPGNSPSEARTWQASCYPILSPSGELLGVGLIARDITDRLQHERKLRESQGRFRSLAESMPQIVWVARFDGYYDYYNQRWYDFTGLTHEDSIGSGWLRPVHAEDVERAERRWKESTSTGIPFEVEYRIRSTDGQYRWFLARALPQRDEKGQIVNWFGTYTDIHDRKAQTQELEDLVQVRARELLETNIALKEEVEIRKKAERSERDAAEELRRSNQELEQFAYVASHDLQEPLRKIQAFSDRLIQKVSDQLDEQGKEYLGRITSSATRMRNLINDLLAFSRVSARNQPFVQIDLAMIVQEVTTDVEERIRQTDGQVNIGPLPRIDGDPMQIRQLFTNLLANALKFHRPEVPPVVTVQAELFNEPNTQPNLPAIEMCRIAITDNGIGFENQFAERIFQIFQRLHGRNRYEGTGIGLAICRKIVERHAGRISASSVLGEGATFVVELPVHQVFQEGSD